MSLHDSPDAIYRIMKERAVRTEVSLATLAELALGYDISKFEKVAPELVEILKTDTRFDVKFDGSDSEDAWVTLVGDEPAPSATVQEPMPEPLLGPDWKILKVEIAELRESVSSIQRELGPSDKDKGVWEVLRSLISKSNETSEIATHSRKLLELHLGTDEFKTQHATFSSHVTYATSIFGRWQIWLFLILPFLGAAGSLWTEATSARGEITENAQKLDQIQSEISDVSTRLDAMDVVSQQQAKKRERRARFKN